MTATSIICFRRGPHHRNHRRCTQLNLTGEMFFSRKQKNKKRSGRPGEMVWKAQHLHELPTNTSGPASAFYITQEKGEKENFSSPLCFFFRACSDERQTTDGAELFKCMKLGQKFQNLPSKVQRTPLVVSSSTTFLSLFSFRLEAFFSLFFFL